MPTRPLLYTTADLVALFGKDRRTIYNWRNAGIIPAPKRIGGQLYWPASEIRAFIKRGGVE